MMKKIALFSSLIIMFLASCNKEPASTSSLSTTNPEDAAIIALQTFNGINSMTDIFFTSYGLKSSPIGTTCPTVTISATAIPYSLVLDWGDGCTGMDGILRKGKISISLTGRMNQMGSVATFTFYNFYTEGHKISGSHSITYEGLNSGNNWPRYKITTEVRIDFENEKFITYKANTWRLQSEGSATATLTDDVWREEGTWSGTTDAGREWSATCSSALVKANTCQWFSKGILTVTPLGEPAVTVNFGDGACDNKATITKNGVSTVVELK